MKHLFVTYGKKAKGPYLVIDLLRISEGSLLMTQACFCRLGNNQQNSCWGLLSRHMNVCEISDALANCPYMENWYIFEKLLPVVTSSYEVCSYLCKVGVSHCVMLSCVSPLWQKYKDFRKVYTFPLGIDLAVLKARAALFIACAFRILTVQRGSYHIVFSVSY